MEDGQGSPEAVHASAAAKDGDARTGGHFYASASDKLRVGLFRLLDGAPFNLSLLRTSLADGNRRFFEAGLFFLHAAKVRPTTKLSPPHDCIRHCARRHLRAEIEHVAPRAVCFLGMTNAAPAAKELFGANVRWEPQEARLESWSGLVAVAPQPVRLPALGAVAAAAVTPAMAQKLHHGLRERQC